MFVSIIFISCFFFNTFRLDDADRKMKESIKARTIERKSKTDTSRSYGDDETRASSARPRTAHLPALKGTGASRWLGVGGTPVLGNAGELVNPPQM